MTQGKVYRVNHQPVSTKKKKKTLVWRHDPNKTKTERTLNPGAHVSELEGEREHARNAPHAERPSHQALRAVRVVARVAQRCCARQQHKQRLRALCKELRRAQQHEPPLRPRPAHTRRRSACATFVKQGTSGRCAHARDGAYTPGLPCCIVSRVGECMDCGCTTCDGAFHVCIGAGGSAGRVQEQVRWLARAQLRERAPLPVAAAHKPQGARQPGHHKHGGDDGRRRAHDGNVVVRVAQLLPAPVLHSVARSADCARPAGCCCRLCGRHSRGRTVAHLLLGLTTALAFLVPHVGHTAVQHLQRQQDCSVSLCRGKCSRG